MGFRKQRKANKGERKPDKDENFDLPVTKDDFDSVPRSFARIFNYKKEQEEKPKEKKNSNEKKETNKPKLELRKGEKLRDFKSRVERVYQKEIAQTVKSVKSVTERKRRNRQQRKLKAQMKKRKRGEDDDDDIRDFDKLRDEVKFGEVADAPPVFKRIPKARGRGKEVLDKKTKEALGNESEEDENMKQLKASHKRKLQNMSASARKALEDERQRAIDMYRAKKAKKMAEAGLTPLS